MILDSENVLSSAQSLAGVSGATASTNYIDMTDDERQIGTGEPVKFRANVQTVFVCSGVTTTITLQVDDNASFTSATTVATFPVLAANAAAGTSVEATIPGGALATERYLRALITPSGAITSGALDIYLVKDSDGHRQMDSGFTISS